MWMSSDGLARIGATVQRGGTAEVDRLLSDVFLQPSPRSQAPLTCPACRHDLVRQPLAAADLFVSACPQGHGAWLDPDIAESLRCLVATRAAVASRHRLLALGALAASSLALLVALSTRRDPPPPPPPLVSAPAAGELTRDGVDLGRLGDDYWPERRWPGARAIPLKESHIDRYAELVYFRDLLALLDAGITNRLNIEGALAVRRTPERYGELYEVYRRHQQDVLTRLRGLEPPPVLAAVHTDVVRATERQIEFYGEFARAKAANPATDLGRLLTHPALREQNEALHAAWDRVRATYTDLDSATSQAIEQHFCGYDII